MVAAMIVDFIEGAALSTPPREVTKMIPVSLDGFKINLRSYQIISIVSISVCLSQINPG